MNPTSLTPHQVLSTLNRLIELNRDGQKGFQEAAEKMEAPAVKTLCLEQSRSRTHFVGELQTLVHALGEEPEDGGTAAGALRRGWMDLKAALGGGDHAILAVVEAGEDHANSEYKMALAKTLPADVREVLERQSLSVRQAHDTIRSLRETLSQ